VSAFIRTDHVHPAFATAQKFPDLSAKLTYLPCQASNCNADFFQGGGATTEAADEV
jgi:hypothetical protein